MIFRERALSKAVDQLERALGEQDEVLLNEAFHALSGAVQGAKPASCVEAGPRMAALLPRVPMGAEGILAVMVGACVEHGADPEACSGPILAGVGEAMRDVMAFPALWEETVGGELPERDHLMLGEVVERIAAVGGMDGRKFGAVSAWTQLPLWEMAGVAVLLHAEIRRAVQADGTLVGLVEKAAQGDADLKCLRYLLKMFDDEPLVVLHRPSGTGYRMRVSRIGDNFQLHTLLAHLLVGGGHIAGEAPSAEVVAAARDTALDGELQTNGAFNLCAADGSWIWNEGCPADIPLVDGERLLVLDPPTYGRTWSAGRFYPALPGDLTLEAVLTRAETEAYLAKTGPARAWPDAD
ncbi:hypothetical protein [Embleya sp. MST-111070]|uniref:hypothetical protein n=1 Tax=Embleya sp. MST-111070 TaxID=3398231 RepID=UPI003F73CBC2